MKQDGKRMMRLLVVEDSELIRKVTRLAFPSTEYELQEAENGLQALALMASAAKPFDAIVLDIRMPDMNGVEFLRAMHQRPQHCETPVVIATSEEDTSELLVEARRLGVAAVLKKPWKPLELAGAVQQATAGRSPPHGPQE